MRSLPRACALTLAALACFLTPATAKPMPAPTLERALASPLIVVGRYESCDSSEASYFGGVVATYRLLKVWKGKVPKGPKSLKVAYAFTDGSACIEPNDWTFDEKLLPKPGQTFVLFLSPSGVKGTYRTYRGGYGRWPADHLRKDERAALRKILSSSAAACSKCTKRHPRQLRLLPKGMIWESRCSPNAAAWRELTFAFEKKDSAQEPKK